MRTIASTITAVLAAFLGIAFGTFTQAAQTATEDSATTAEAPASPEQNDGLVGYWSFDSGDARDNSGNGHDGHVIGCSPVADAFGKRGFAYRFNGENDSIAVPHGEAFDFGAGPFTLSCWVRTTAQTGDGDFRDDLITKGDASIRGFALSLEDNCMALIYGWQQAHFGTTPVNDGKWHHLLAMRGSKGGISLYLDGKPERVGRTGFGQDVDPTGMDNVTTRDPLIIGKHGSIQASFFTGELDEVRIYNRALSPSEVMRLHSGRATSEGPARQPVSVAVSPAPLDFEKAQTEAAMRYASAHPEVREYVLWTAKTFGPGGQWLNEDAFAALSGEAREAKIQYLVRLLEQGEYGRHLCAGLAEASALKDKRLVPGLMKMAGYHREGGDYDCRPKWIAVSALARQESDDAVPLLVSLVDHGNQNTRNWARAALCRKTGKDFGQDKQAWAKWWQSEGHESIGEKLLKPWEAPPPNKK